MGEYEGALPPFGVALLKSNWWVEPKHKFLHEFAMRDDLGQVGWEVSSRTWFPDYFSIFSISWSWFWLVLNQIVLQLNKCAHNWQQVLRHRHWNPFCAIVLPRPNGGMWYLKTHNSTLFPGIAGNLNYIRGGRSGEGMQEQTGGRQWYNWKRRGVNCKTNNFVDMVCVRLQ